MKRIEKAHIPVVALTHEGMKGKNNEDRFAVSSFQLSEKNSTSVLLAILSDGIGGHRAGEVASEMVVNLISTHVEQSDGRHPMQVLQEAIHYASDEVYKASQVSPERQGMGATCSCAWVIGNRLNTATVGDSRIYLIRGEKIIQISTDHTWIQEALDHGIITPDQIKGHPNAHIIRRYIGSPKPPEVDFRLRLSDKETDEEAVANQGMSLNPSDRLILCSDGLTDLVTDMEILKIFQALPMQAAVERLISLANERGGHDNITIVGLQIPGKVRKSGKSGWRLVVLTTLGFLAFLAVIGAVVLAYLWFLRQGVVRPQPTATIEALQVTETPLPLTPTPSATLELESQAKTETTPTIEAILPEVTLTPWPTDTLQPSGST